MKKPLTHEAITQFVDGKENWVKMNSFIKDPTNPQIRILAQSLMMACGIVKELQEFKWKYEELCK